MLIHPMPDPIALSIGPLAIRWYGLMYLLAFAQFIALGRLRIRQAHIAQAGWRNQHLDDMLFYGVLGVIVGGRLGEVLFYNLPYYLDQPLEIFAIWKGGMSFHGGFLGVLAAMWFWSRRAGRPLMEVMDFIAPLVPLGYAAGRIGNFINSELPGRIADPTLPWAMIWPTVDQLPRHPSPIYQALVDGLLLFIILWLYARKPRPMMAVSGVFAAGYGMARFFTEYFRIPDYEIALLGFSVSAGQMLSLPMILLGLILLFVAYKKTDSYRPAEEALPPRT
ncbi:MAG: prolipoprotein diacylglyceryl transferase [Pseudomonadota bacterium]